MDIRKYIYGHCVNPTRIKVFDALTQSYQYNYVPCGKCLHCRNSKVSEWTTRLYAHSMYCKNVYYFTLDYAPFDENNPVAMRLAADTAAAYHAINYHHTYGLHPILLQKSHLQKFFKRLRKSFPDRSFQYFACGEYGGSYKGHGFGRPHFHVLLFTNDTFSDSDIKSAWTLDGYSIGTKLDWNDLRANGTFIVNKSDPTKNAKFVFSYVCKYLQKKEFDFNNLATIEYHKAYFNTLQKYCTNEGELFPEFAPITDPKIIDKNWKKYCKDYAPFVCCSKRPAIGLQYFKDNIQRFQAQDFRLPGLPKSCTSFPLYFIRKTKESLCCYKAIGETSCEPSSCSRIGYIVSLLREVRDLNNSIENWTANTPRMWCESKICPEVLNRSDMLSYYIPYLSLSFYDADNKLYYNFNGYDYNIRQKVRKIGFVDLGSISIDNVITMLDKSWLQYAEKYLQPSAFKKSLLDVELDDAKKQLFPNTPLDEIDDKFKEYVYCAYRNEIARWKTKGKIIANTKIVF